MLGYLDNQSLIFMRTVLDASKGKAIVINYHSVTSLVLIERCGFFSDGVLPCPATNSRFHWNLSKSSIGVVWWSFFLFQQRLCLPVSSYCISIGSLTRDHSRPFYIGEFNQMPMRNHLTTALLRFNVTFNWISYSIALNSFNDQTSCGKQSFRWWSSNRLEFACSLI